MLVLNLQAFDNKKYAAYDRFHGNGPYGEISTKKEPIWTLGFALTHNKKKYQWDLTKLKDSSSGILIDQDCLVFRSRKIVPNISSYFVISICHFLAKQ